MSPFLRGQCFQVALGNGGLLLPERLRPWNMQLFVKIAAFLPFANNMSLRDFRAWIEIADEELLWCRDSGIEAPCRFQAANCPLRCDAQRLRLLVHNPATGPLGLPYYAEGTVCFFSKACFVPCCLAAEVLRSPTARPT